VVKTPDGPVLIAALADGAGSAERGDVGAALACALFSSEIAALLAGGGRVDMVDRVFLTGLLERHLAHVGLHTRADQLSPRAFASTLLGAVVGDNTAVFFQIGDGAIVIGGDSAAYDWVFWPQEGEYANLTHFATDPDAPERITVRLVEKRIEQVALFSDGLQRLALHYASQTAHAPFFRPLFAEVQAAPAGHAVQLSEALGRWLSSPAVANRTDDDTSLILATRQYAATPAPQPASDDGSL
jgi:hypothetical protein